MARLFAMIFVLMALGVSAYAGDYPGKPNDPCLDPGYKTDGCPAPVPSPLPPHHPQQPLPPYMGNPGNCLCEGIFEGFYFNQPGPVAFQVNQTGNWEQLQVQSWWRGGFWFGQGICRQVGPFQAQFELYFPGAPVHRGVIFAQQFGGIWMEGQLDGFFPFRLQRVR